VVLLRKLIIVFFVSQLAACSWQSFIGAEQAIAKPVNDSREYRYRKLDNGLQVLLVSDPSADKAGASLDVKVGSRQDPSNYQGLAHFLEHMLFLGTSKYPRAGEYQEFITANGGNHNAFTSFENTNYFFDVSADALEPALDRFAQFFAAPLFNAEFVEREVNAVNSEYRAKVRSDRRRELAVLKSQLNKAHPFSRFSVGNLKTLQSGKPVQLRQALLGFYQQYYSAGLMTLTVIGRESLDELESMVVPRFTDVENRQVTVAPIEAPLFEKNSLPKWLRIEPVQNRRVLSVNFPVADPQPYWRTKPLSYIGNVLGHEGEGSLLHLLKDKGWAESLSAGQSFAFNGGALFGVEIALTEEGLRHAEDVVSLVFADIRLLKEQGVEGWRYREQSGLAEQQFLFRTTPAVIHDVVSLSMALQDYPPQEVLRGATVMNKYEPAIIDAFLDEMRPDNALVTLTAPGAKTDVEVERYKVKYGTRKVTGKMLADWQNSKPTSLHLPAANRFIASDFSLAQRKPDGETRTPIALGEVKGVALWLNTDDVFEVPKGRSYVLLETPHAAGTLAERVQTELWLKMVDDQLNELTYPAQLAGLTFSLSVDWRGIELSLGGYNQKQPELMAAVLQALRNTEWNQARFDRLKTQRLRLFENERKRSPYEQLVSELPRALTRDNPPLTALRAATAQATLLGIQRHADQVLGKLRLRMLVDGNFDRRTAEKLAAVVAENMPQSRVQGPVQEVVKLPVSHYVREVKTEHDDAALLSYLQSSELGKTGRVAMGLAAQIMSADFYYRLRTEKQLGYIVSAGVYPLREVPGMYFLVQSPVADSGRLQDEVSRYLRNWVAEGVTPEVFAQHKASLIKRLAEQPENLWEAADRHWQDLLEGYPSFDSRDQLRDALDAMSYEQWWGLISKDLGEQRSLLIYTRGKWPDRAPQGKRVEKLSTFKSALPVARYH
jgi:insulysin